MKLPRETDARGTFYSLLNFQIFNALCVNIRIEAPLLFCTVTAQILSQLPFCDYSSSLK